MTDQVVFKDFTKKRSEIAFGLDGETFECVKALAPDDLQKFALAMQGNGSEEKIAIDVMLERVKNAFGFVLQDEAKPRFLAKFSDRENPVDIEQLTDIVGWLTEQYTARPTEPSSDSLTGSPSDGFGTSSPVGAAFAESIPSS